jgi:carboxyl-terminal processing protease
MDRPFFIMESIMFAPIMRAGVVGFLTLLLLPTTLLHAGSLVPNTHAVLVGVSTYPDTKIKPRQNAEADAKAFYEMIVAKEYFGADPKNVHLLLSQKGANSELATRANILSALAAVVKKAGPDDLVIFAFFGQGCPLGEQVGFFGTDATAADRIKTALDGADLGKTLEGLKTPRFCAFIDVNLTDFENSKDAARDLNLTALSSIVMGDPDTPTAKRPKGRVMFLASTGLSSTVQLEKHSLFAKTLLDGMKGKADKDGYEADGVVMVSELVKYVDEELPKAARALGKTKDEKSQAAIILRNPPTHFAIGRTPSVAPTAEKRLERFKDIAGKAGVAKDIVAEGERFLSRMPRVKYQQALRKEYQKLADGSVKVPDFLKERDRIEDETRLPRGEAEQYAKGIQAAFVTMGERYFREKNFGELAAGGIEGLYQFADEPIPADLAARLATAGTLKKPQITELLADARQALHRREDLDRREVKDLGGTQIIHPAEEATLKFIFTRNLDRYSHYVDAESVRKFLADTSGQFKGIGIQIRRDPVRDLLQVVTPIKDSPAYKAGVKTGDWIVKVTREVDSDGNALAEPEIIAGKGLPLDEAVKKIVGKPGTKVRVSFEREGESNPVEFELTRASIVTESLFGVKRNADDSWDFMLDPAKKIGYARIGSFTDTTHIELRKAINALKKQGMKGFILDLRFCPGGKLNTALQIGDMFINDEMIVGIRYRGKEEIKEMGKRFGSELDFPMAVLVNRHSASASELVSACWQDHKRVTVVGDRSFGKGTVVTYSYFEPTGGVLNLTTATFWRPSGKNLEKIMTSGKEDEDWGVKPDILVKLGRHDETDLFEHLRKQEIIPRRDAPQKEAPAAFRDLQLERAADAVRELAK